MQARTIITAETPMGGQQYPFFKHLQNWELVIDRVRMVEELRMEPHNPGHKRLVLSWIGDGKINRLYAEESNWKMFRAKFDLHTTLHKGALTLSKRISRVVRPMFAWAEFYTRDLNIRIDTTLDEKLWDGAGLVSRKMLRKMQLYLPAMPSEKKSYIYNQLENARRVEYTILNGKGQFKGHALVVDDMEEDFVLPNDPKKELRMGSGKTFVSFDFPHGKDSMWIDEQSLINLGEFIPLEQYEEWLTAHMEDFLRRLDAGDIEKSFAKIKSESWAMPEFFVTGGQKHWFRGPLRTLASQWTTQQENKGMRLPVNGCRVYVMTQAVGRAAGWDVDLQPGQIKIDIDHNVAFVYDEDWKSFLMNVWGGPDMDDALWAIPYINADGMVKVIAWRSPNQNGEYAIFDPADIDTVFWAGDLPHLDESKLPTRIDQKNIVYQNLIADDEPFGKGRVFSMGLMEEAIAALEKNAGILGQYCNLLMVMAACGIKTKTLPDSLEKLIDTTVKTGGSLEKFAEWMYKVKAYIIKKRYPIPLPVAYRLSKTVELNLTTDHWLDRLYNMKQNKIAEFNNEIEHRMDRSQPPAQLIKYAISNPKLAAPARQIRKVYATILREAMPDPTDEDFTRAHMAVAVELERFPEREDKWGIMAHILMQSIAERKSDGAAWNPVTGHLTLRMLQEIGVIAFIDGNGHLYMNAAPEPVREIKSTKLWGTWFNMAQVVNPDLKAMSDVPQAERKVWKERIANRAWSGAMIDITTIGERYVAKTQLGNLLGYVDKGTEITEGKWNILAALAEDGNLSVYLEEVEDAVPAGV